MSAIELPLFWELRRRFDAVASSFDAPYDEATRVLAYLRNRGAVVRTVDDVFGAVQSLFGEEELQAFRCREGVAITHASDGWWLLLLPQHCRAVDDGADCTTPVKRSEVTGDRW